MIHQTLAILRELAQRGLGIIKAFLGLLAALGIGLVFAVTSLILDVDMGESGGDWSDE